ncbi:MAG: FAD-dependent oxidoreductase, partial [Alicyclobacillus sp.]|nr:FAD-dependent oxidoreductase [Alicyclobacillus sp.]
GKRLHLTKGVHIVVQRAKLPVRHAVYFDTDDGRMVFVIPRDSVTYIGTTDTDYEGPLTDPPVLLADVEYLLHAVRQMFPSCPLQLSDVCSSWAGLRPLIHEEGKAPSELSRKDEVLIAPSGLMSIAGGKLTGYRKMAERVVDRVMRQLEAEDGLPFQPSRTKGLALVGGQVPEADVLAQLRSFGPELAGCEQERVWRGLYRKYGANALTIAQLAKERVQEGSVSAQLALLCAEWEYTVNEEMSSSLCDFLIRRSGRLFFERTAVVSWLPKFTLYAAAWMGWSPEETQVQVAKWQQAWQAAVSFLEATPVAVRVPAHPST